MNHHSNMPLAGVAVVITRPVGHGRRLARGVRAYGGSPVLLPGLSLRSVEDTVAVGATLRAACAGDWVIFSSPSAVQFAAALTPLTGTARFAAVGRGTARALARHGVSHSIVPDTSQDAAGLLKHPALARVQGLRVSVIGAAGGRAVMQNGLRERGAQVSDVHVYHRRPARLDRRHRQALEQMPLRRCVLLSSAATLRCLHAALHDQWQILVESVAIVSSERLRRAVVDVGFIHVAVAHSAVGEDMLACAIDRLGARS